MDRQSTTSGYLIYDVKHLATFTVDKTKKGSVFSAEEGIKKLKNMEKTQGIWSMDCELLVDNKYLVILDKNTQEEIEIIPLRCINDPTGVISNDRFSLYNNIFLFTVVYKSSSKKLFLGSNEPPRKPEMHIFECVDQNPNLIVDEILVFKDGRTKDKNRFTSRSSIASSGDQVISKRDVIQQNSVRTKAKKQSKSKSSRQKYEPLGESIEEDVQILNHCFDDIERFVSRLQNGKNYQLDKSAMKDSKVEKKKKKKPKNDRSESKDRSNLTSSNKLQMPSDSQFHDILQKFKLAFNLCAALKTHIHDPNAPELIHHLFIPLEIATTHCTNLNIIKDCWSPLFNQNTIELFSNCLTSKEYDFWQSLGDAWTMKYGDIFMGPIEPYNPIFYDGWAPVLNHTGFENNNKTILPHDQKDISKSTNSNLPNNLPFNYMNNSKLLLNELKSAQSQNNNVNDSNMIKWAYNLHQTGSRIYEVTYDRKGNNEKELSVKSGELIEVLDNSRNWWPVRNIHNQIGHVPNTILQPYEFQSTKLASIPSSNQRQESYFFNSKLDGYF